MKATWILALSAPLLLACCGVTGPRWADSPAAAPPLSYVSRGWPRAAVPTEGAEVPSVPTAQDPAGTFFDLGPVKKWSEDETDQVPPVFSGADSKWRTSERYAGYAKLSRTSEALGREEFVVILGQVIQRLEQSDAFGAAAGNPNGPLIRQRLVTRLKLLVAGLAARPDKSLWAALQALQAGPQAASAVAGAGFWQRGSLPSAPKGWASDLVFFAEPNPPVSPVLLFASHTTGDERNQVEEFHAYCSTDQAVEFLAVVEQVHRMLFGVLPVSQALAKLAANDAAWENYLRRGYSQYPWEHLLNGFLVSSSWDRPPQGQFVFLHPEPAVVVDLRRSDSASADAALLVHGLGYVRYLGDQRDWFLGMSATGSVTSDSDNGLGYGATLHMGMTATTGSVPHLSLGILWQDTETGSSGPFLSVSVDVFRFFSSPDVSRLRN